MAKCKTCQENECTCVDKGCKQIDASCVVYKPNGRISLLTCLKLPVKTTADKIFEEIDSRLCEFTSIPLLDCVKKKFDVADKIETVTQLELLNLLQLWVCNSLDQNVKVTPSDASTGFLFDKVTEGDCIILTVVKDDEGNQKLKIDLDFPCIAAKIPTCFEINTNSCITVDCSTCGGGPCEPQPITPVIVRNGLVLTGSGCNGTLQWYSDDKLVGSGYSFTGESKKSYYAKCVTACGESPASNIIVVPVINKFVTRRTTTFIKNDCGQNTCNMPCIGTSVIFSKEYTSTVSQSVADALAENDPLFATDGQTFANSSGTCNCPDCNCVFPAYNSNIVKTNASCDGSVISATGSILIAGVTNADKFGYYIGAGDYAGITYNSAISLTNYNQGNIEANNGVIRFKSLSTETRVVFRLFNKSNNCYKDIVVVMTPPECSQEQISIGDIDISCELDEVVCKNWTVRASSNGGTLYYLPCDSNVYTPETLAANVVVSRCSTLEPQIVGGVVTENGICQ